MSIKYDPNAMLQKLAPAKKLKKLVSSKVTLKRTVLSHLNDAEFLDEKSVKRVALKTIKSYKERIKDNPDVKAEILKDPKQLIQRVQNEVITQIAGEIKEKYKGERYEWLPSDAEEPDPEHQLNYGKIFIVGYGEMPGDRIGCRCGMRILVEDSSLEI
jgi:hypothetical protein